VKSGFFNSNITGYDDEGMPIYDRAQEASFFAKYFSSFIGNGIYPNPSTSMQVLKNEGMSVVVSAGCCFINGYFGWVEENETLAIETADSLARIDRVVARLNFVDRTIDLVVKKGTPSSNPIPVDIERTSDYYEIVLANVKVNANVSKITQANITDMRLDTSVCGIVTGVIDQVDTSTLINQYLSWYEELTEQAETDMQSREKSFDDWFEEMKDKLSGDVAGKLQLLIDNLTAELATTKEILEDAVSPIITENGDYITTEDGNMLVIGM
jgi:hypothetical protein